MSYMTMFESLMHDRLKRTKGATLTGLTGRAETFAALLLKEAKRMKEDILRLYDVALSTAI